MTTTKKPDPRALILDIKKRSTEKAEKKKADFLLMGEKGVGKTRVAVETCPKPVLVHSFDPGGTDVILNKIDGSKILVDTRFEDDDRKSPSAYREWELEFNRLRAAGAFEFFGTYVLDSLTNFGIASIWQIMHKEARTPPGLLEGKLDPVKQGMRLQDWGLLLDHFITLGRKMCKLPCHTIMTGHIGRDKDQLTGAFVNFLTLPGQSRDQLPNNISEVYALTSDSSGKRKFITVNWGNYKAATRMGTDGKIPAEAEPNIRKLLKACGRDWEDKEPL